MATRETTDNPIKDAKELYEVISSVKGIQNLNYGWCDYGFEGIHDAEKGPDVWNSTKESLHRATIFMEDIVCSCPPFLACRWQWNDDMVALHLPDYRLIEGYYGVDQYKIDDMIERFNYGDTNRERGFERGFVEFKTDKTFLNALLSVKEKINNDLQETRERIFTLVTENVAPFGFDTKHLEGDDTLWLFPEGGFKA